MRKRVRPVFKLFVCPSLFLAFAFGLTLAAAGIQKSASVAFAATNGFAWHANRPGITRAQVALGRATRLRIEFAVKNANGKQVMFGIAREYAQMGISIVPKAVTISNGVARAQVEFQCPPGMPLGRFDMLVVMVDAKTKQEMGKGIVPFMLLPAGVGGC